MSIANILREKRPSLSFEFFPPKTLALEKVLFDTIDGLQSENADFSSVTFGAGGAFADKTFEWIKYIKDTCSYETMMHITCIGFDKSVLDNILDKLSETGIANILALRGDMPKEAKPFSMEFPHASDLIQYISRRGEFCIGAAGYPEGHPESESIERDMDMMKLKVDCGASFIITQLFFDNKFFYQFRERAEKMGINAPIIAGIMPITSFSQIERFQKMCSSHVPENLIRDLDGKDEDYVMKYGVEYAVRQCEDLIAKDAAGLHFYTLNRSAATKNILEHIKIFDNKA
ncbi:MAG: methylenetetrahydrofolate reductase [NAD(P)H] [Mucispirillum sp.]|nr:methylenetetrahydrofolate reductase [NAD(P)H] [Mucispirillum sp.]